MGRSSFARGVARGTVYGVGFASFVLSACQRLDPDGAPQAPKGPVIGVDRPIVNGVTETGYPAVGALVVAEPFQYGGSFCTATLIAPNWVLTAGHCVTGPEIQQQGITTQNTTFFVGNDARPTQSGAAPTGGKFYDVDQFVPNPNYDPQQNTDDIALVHLSQPVTGVTPMAINASSINNAVGTTCAYVGFGATEGIHEDGSGLKRSTSFPITDVYADEYVSGYNGHGTCFGDSGGPGLMTQNGKQVIVGVTSAGTACQGANCDPCQTPTISTRVDAYATWINQTIGAPPPSCKTTAGLCDCDQACQADGSCNNSVCQTASCSDAYGCMSKCSSAACQQACIASATPDAQADLQTMLKCFDDHCANEQTDAGFQTCVQANCKSELDVCFPTVTGDKLCADVYDCLGNCGQNDQTCWQGCYETGTADAQKQVDSLLGCLHDNCGSITDQTQFQTCANTKCADPIDTCFPGQSGDQTCAQVDDCMSRCANGDQPCLQSCFKTGTHDAQSEYNALAGCVNDKCANATDATYQQCVSSNCGAELHACLPNAETCTDADNDGVCAPQDCNDDDPTIKPGGTERCGDNVDNDCDGQTDEGCATCTDNDHDHYCVPDDCDDNNPNRNPGMVETCGDHVDNNCDGQTDETCVVADPGPDAADAGDTSSGNGDTSSGATRVTNSGGDTSDTSGGTPQQPASGGKSAGGCAGGGEGLSLGFVGLALVALRGRRVRRAAR